MITLPKAITSRERPPESTAMSTTGRWEAACMGSRLEAVTLTPEAARMLSGWKERVDDVCAQRLSEQRSTQML